MKKSSPLEILKRQIEILSLIEREPHKHSIHDLCALFNVETPTINRDLQALRSLGFDIHSTRKKLKLFRKLNESEYVKFLSLYLPLSRFAFGFPKNISLVVKKMGKRVLQTFVTLVNAIENKREIEITYLKMYDNETVIRRVEPYVLFPTTKDWMLIAKHGKIFKQFFVDNIKEIQTLDTAFSRDKNFSAETLFLYSWETFRGEKPITVKLHFSKNVATFISNRVWSETQTLEPQTDGSLLFTVQIGDVEEIISWIMSWGKEVEIIEPMDLKKMVKERAKEILRQE
jgi:predicted DNA-binding transcriptional regulator YafY